MQSSFPLQYNAGWKFIALPILPNLLMRRHLSSGCITPYYGQAVHINILARLVSGIEL